MALLRALLTPRRPRLRRRPPVAPSSPDNVQELRARAPRHGTCTDGRPVFYDLSTRCTRHADAPHTICHHDVRWQRHLRAV